MEKSEKRKVLELAESIPKISKKEQSKYVKLNIGGKLFYTTKETLTKEDDTMLSAMFSGRMDIIVEDEGWIVIDRSGKHFDIILNYLRDGTVILPDNHRHLVELLAEARYYCLKNLISACEEALKALKKPEAICVVALLTSEKELETLISDGSKPAILLVVQRQNNKYSYTSVADDSILKNIELFDKLSLRFNERICFLKNVIGTNEICCWSFYGHGKKVSEVSCASIVYSSNNKQTKVEFPEARIYEETLKILLYENRSPPNQQLLEATSSYRFRDVEEQGAENTNQANRSFRNRY